MEIRLIKTMPYFKNVGIRRFVSHWLYARRWKKLAFGDSARPDLILCSLPPLETSGVMLELKKAFGCMGVVDIMDAWPETFERFFPRWALGLLRRQAARAYQGADGVSAVGAAYLSLAKQYLRGIPKPLHLCYHGIELSQWEEAGAKPKRADLLKVFYVGNMADAYDLKTVVQAVRELMKEGLPVRLDLAGDGPLRKSLEAMASDEGMMPRGAVGGDGAIITFHGVVLGSKLSELMHGADIGIIPMFPSSQVAIPYKLGDYAVHGLPVVNSLPGETCELLNQFKCGSSYVAGDVASLKQALTTAWRLKQEDALAFEGWRRNARRMAEELFDADRIYPEFVRWLEGLGEGGRV